MRTLLTSCLTVVINVGTPAQSTHLVGPGGLPQIRDALAIATSGDIVLVEAGTYAHFDANVGCTIRALVPGTVDVAYDVTFQAPGCTFFCLLSEGPTRLQPPAGQALHVVGVNFLANSVAGTVTVRHRVEILSGRVTLDQCQLSSLEIPALRVHAATAHLQDCSVVTSSFSTGAAGVIGEDADITAVGCGFYGGSPIGIGVGGYPGAGLELTNSRLHASDVIAGGGSTSFGSLGAPGLRTFGASIVWLSDSTLLSGPNACAIESLGATLRLDRCTLHDNNTGCISSPIGGTLLGVERVQPLSPGAVFELEYRTDPHGFVLVFASPQLGTVNWFPVLEQPSWLDDTQSFSAALVVADASGLATVSWQIPAGPGITDQTLWFKGISGLLFPLQASAVTGGVAR